MRLLLVFILFFLIYIGSGFGQIPPAHHANRTSPSPSNRTYSKNSEYSDTAKGHGNTTTSIGNTRNTEVLKNADYLGKPIDRTFTSGGLVYGTYDNSKMANSALPLGFAFCLFVFSIYMYVVSARLYRHYYKRPINEAILVIFLFSTIMVFNGWGMLMSLDVKGLPTGVLFGEMLFHPDEFVPGIVLSSLLLLSIAIFRFALIVRIPNTGDAEIKAKDSSFSMVAMVISIISVAANIATVWKALH